MPNHFTFLSVTKTWHSTTYPAISPLKPTSSAAGKLVVITGAGTGIGAETAVAFAAAGATTIALLGRTASSLEETAARIKTAHPSVEVHVIPTDITSPSSVSAAFERISQLQPIDIFLNNAGYLPALGSVAELDVDELTKGLDVNIKGSLLVTQAVLKRVARDAVIINTSSGAAHVPYVPDTVSYAISKLAALKMFEYVAAENPDIRVFNVQPGYIETEMFTRAHDMKKEKTTWPKDDVQLPAHFAVWLAGEEARELSGKMLWANWDVEELLACKEIKEKTALNIGLLAWGQTSVDVPL